MYNKLSIAEQKGDIGFITNEIETIIQNGSIIDEYLYMFIENDMKICTSVLLNLSDIDVNTDYVGDCLSPFIHAIHKNRVDITKEMIAIKNLSITDVNLENIISYVFGYFKIEMLKMLFETKFLPSEHLNFTYYNERVKKNTNGTSGSSGAMGGVRQETIRDFFGYILDNHSENKIEVEDYPIFFMRYDIVLEQFISHKIVDLYDVGEAIQKKIDINTLADVVYKPILVKVEYAIRQMNLDYILNK